MSKWHGTSRGVRAPHMDFIDEALATTDSLLYRRGNFIGSFDQVICDALRATNDAQIALSPGFRWGTSLLPGDTIRYENVLDQTCMTYPETYARDMTGGDLKLILEDVADNLFNPTRIDNRVVIWSGPADFVTFWTQTRRLATESQTCSFAMEPRSRPQSRTE